MYIRNMFRDNTVAGVLIFRYQVIEMQHSVNIVSPPEDDAIFQALTIKLILHSSK